MKRKRIVSVTDGAIQKSLTFFGEKEEKIEQKIEQNLKLDETKGIEIHKEIVENKIIEKRPSNQIETDYYELSRIEVCAKRLRERFNIDIEIIPVRYGSKPPINEKVYGYYMLITIKGRGKESIIEFIQKDCNLKVYT